MSILTVALQKSTTSLDLKISSDLLKSIPPSIVLETCTFDCECYDYYGFVELGPHIMFV